MKTPILYFLASTAMLSFASCTNDARELVNDQPQALKQIVMITQDFDTEPDSRTLYQIADGVVSCTWAANDTVGVFPNEGMQTGFPMASGSGTKNATFHGGGWALKDGSTYAAYYPFIADILLDKNAVPVSYIGQTQTGNASMAHLGGYDYMVATPTAPEFGAAHFTFKHLSALVQLKITVPQQTKIVSVKLMTETDVFAVEGKVDIMAATPVITPVTSAKGIVLNVKDVAVADESQVITLYLMLPPTDISGQTLKALVKTNKGTGEISLEGKNFQAGKAYGLSASLEADEIVGDGTYKDGVVSLAKAGTMKQLLEDDYLHVTSLKVVGPINGDDVYYLRRMLGDWNVTTDGWGKLTTLDLSDATIVKGGGSYSSTYRTSDNVIGTYMFAGCTNLQDIILPDNITAIADKAFLSCPALKTIIVPDRVISIGSYAFHYCESLMSVTIGEGVTTISDNAFHGCKSLKSIDIPNSLSSMGEYVFYECSSLTSVTIPESVTSIEAFSFTKCSALKTVSIPDGVTKIGSYAFSECSSLTSIDIPDGVTSISERVFLRCSSLSSVHIPSGVTSIDCYAFYQCDALKSVYITDLTAWCKIDFGCEKGSNPLSNGAKLYLNNKLLTQLSIPEGIKTIKKLTFQSCSSITGLTIDNDVTSIGEMAFTNCSSLSTVVIGDNVTSIDKYAFSGCSSLIFVEIGDGVTSIGGWSFYECTSLIQLSLGKSVSSIGDAAFMHSPIKICYSYASVPPGFNSTYTNSTFARVDPEATLYVPYAYLSVYKSRAWSNIFKNIKKL